VTLDAVSRSFEEYVAARGHALLRFGYVLTGDRHLSEDLVQEALARVHRRWGRIGALDRPDAYVRRVIVNDFLSWKRRAASRLVFVADPPDGPSAQAYGGDHGAALADREAMWQLLERLPRQQRAVLVLRFYEDWTDEEISHLVHCSPATVRAHASKALARLRAAADTPSILNGAG
jgi:RNA polymerase sigma-70 factor (sigma-E family)